MGKLSQRKKDEALKAYFEEGLEAAEIAARLHVTEGNVLAVLGDKELLTPYHRKSEAAKLRAQICVNESAEEAARRQAELLRADEDEKARAMSQRAAKDILDRAGVRVAKERKEDVRVTFVGWTPQLGMPGREA